MRALPAAGEIDMGGDFYDAFEVANIWRHDRDVCVKAGRRGATALVRTSRAVRCTAPQVRSGVTGRSCPRSDALLLGRARRHETT